MQFVVSNWKIRLFFSRSRSDFFFYPIVCRVDLSTLCGLVCVCMFAAIFKQCRSTPSYYSTLFTLHSGTYTQITSNKPSERSVFIYVHRILFSFFSFPLLCCKSLNSCSTSTHLKHSISRIFHLCSHRNTRICI